jgi:hypothetical protein
MYIHKRDGVNVASYLLPLHNYANQQRNEPLRVKAIYILAIMYREWPDQLEKAVQWRKKIVDYYSKTGERGKLLHQVSLMASSYAELGNKQLAAYYYKWMDELSDSLNCFPLLTVGANVIRKDAGLMTRLNYFICLTPISIIGCSCLMHLPTFLKRKFFCMFPEWIR